MSAERRYDVAQGRKARERHAPGPGPRLCASCGQPKQEARGSKKAPRVVLEQAITIVAHEIASRGRQFTNEYKDQVGVHPVDKLSMGGWPGDNVRPQEIEGRRAMRELEAAILESVAEAHIPAPLARELRLAIDVHNAKDRRSRISRRALREALHRIESRG